MRRALGVALALLLFGEASVAEALEARLERALGARALRGARVSALVVDADSGATLFERSADRALVPASNQKVLTSLAALSALGPAHRFTTRIYADRAPDASGAVGTLYVLGGGDPALTSEQWWRLVADLRAQGLQAVTGDLVLDDQRFDRHRWHPAWGEVSSRAYHGPVSALGANYGAFRVRVEAGERAGEPVVVSVDPPVSYLRVVNRARTAAPGTGERLQVDREPALDHERVVVRGSLPAGAGHRWIARSVSDPTRYAGGVLQLQLDSLGVAVGGSVRVARVPEGAVLLHEFEGMPLSEVVRRFMKWSNNAVGETLLKGLAVHAGSEQGSWETGVAAMSRELTGLGLDLSGATLVDGSGLAYQNRVSPRLLVGALQRARGAFGLGPELFSALPIAATDGTLKKRAAEAEGVVRAKTGLLTRVTGLSGVAHAGSGRELLFSVLVNGYRSGARPAMDALDGFAAALIR